MNSPHHAVEASALSETVSAELHSRLHWAAIRAVCQNHDLARDQRRAKLRFLLEGFTRSAQLAATELAGS